MILAPCFRKINRLYILKYGMNVGYIILHHAPRIKACPPSQAFRNSPQSLQRNVRRKSISQIRQRCKPFISILKSVVTFSPASRHYKSGPNILFNTYSQTFYHVPSGVKKIFTPVVTRHTLQIPGV